MENKLIITPDIKISELLETYPELESKLVEFSPKLKMLVDPLIRDSVAAVTTLKQAAVIGEIGLPELMNQLQKATGQDEIAIADDSSPGEKNEPAWLLKENIEIEYDAEIDLAQGVHPAQKVSDEMDKLEKDKIYLLITPFVPVPLIEMMQNKGYEVYSNRKDSNRFNTYIKK